MMMSLVIVLPNNRRSKVTVTPNSSIVQILEEVCEKHGLDASTHSLHYRNKALDLTSTVRFSNISNNAVVELQKCEKRAESKVTCQIITVAGERVVREFKPSTTLWEVVGESKDGSANGVVYMNRETCGEQALRDTTLKSLGLVSGRAALRLVYKQGQGQAHSGDDVMKAKPVEEVEVTVKKAKQELPPVKKAEHSVKPEPVVEPVLPMESVETAEESKEVSPEVETMEVSQDNDALPYEVHNWGEGNRSGKAEDLKTSSEEPQITRASVEFQAHKLDDAGSIVYHRDSIPPSVAEEFSDDVYDVTFNDVKVMQKLHTQALQQLENKPLLTKSLREAQAEVYTTAQIRVQFPDGYVIQTIVSADSTVYDVRQVIVSHLHAPDAAYEMYTAPPKHALNPADALRDVGCLPAALIYYRHIDDATTTYLKQEVTQHVTTFSAAQQQLYPTTLQPSTTAVIPSTTAATLPSTAAATTRPTKTNAKNTDNVPSWFKKGFGKK